MHVSCKGQTSEKSRRSAQILIWITQVQIWASLGTSKIVVCINDQNQVSLYLCCSTLGYWKIRIKTAEKGAGRNGHYPSITICSVQYAKLDSNERWVKESHLPCHFPLAVDYFRNYSPFPPMSYTCVNTILPCSWCSRHVTPLPASFSQAALPSLRRTAQGCFTAGTPVTDMLTLPTGCGAAGDPCRACCPPAGSWRWEILPPALPFLHCFTLQLICLFCSSLSMGLFHLLSPGLCSICFYRSVNMIKANGVISIVSQHNRAEKKT